MLGVKVGSLVLFMVVSLISIMLCVIVWKLVICRCRWEEGDVFIVGGFFGRYVVRLVFF